MKRVSLYVLILGLALLFAACSSNNNDGGGTPVSLPTISSISPNKVSRGQTHVEGSILGTNLGSVVSVSLGDGITVEHFSSSSAGEIQITFSVSASAAAGARTISVTTSGGTASSATAFTVDNNRAPVAKFTISPDAGAKNTLFTFDATQSSDPDGGTIATYKWTFGDGQTGNGRVATHQFNKGGTFEVILKVTDRNNTPATASKSVEVANGLAPVARYTVSPESGDIDTTFHFNGSASTDKDGTITRYNWVFGDGATATGSAVDHKFRSAGVFTVVLTVTDNDGLGSALNKDVRVENFNEQKAKDEMGFIVTRFFARYSKLDRLSADQIVEGWSSDPECNGRDREIKIIERQQITIAHTNASITGPIDVLVKPDHVNGNVNVTAVFDWVNKNGTTGHAKVEHDFSMKFLGGEWMICDFKVIKDL